MDYKTKEKIERFIIFLVVIEIIGFSLFYLFNWFGIVLFIAGFIYYLWCRQNKKKLLWFLDRPEEIKSRVYTKDEIISDILNKKVNPTDYPIPQINNFCNYYSTDTTMRKDTYRSSLEEYITYLKNNGIVEKDDDLEFHLRKEYITDQNNVLDNRRFASVWYDVNSSIKALESIKLLANLVYTKKFYNKAQFAEYILNNCFIETKNGYTIKDNRGEAIYNATKYLGYSSFISNCNDALVKLTDYRNKLIEFHKHFEDVKKNYWVIKSGIEGEHIAQGYINTITKNALYNVAIKHNNKIAENDVIMFTTKGIFTLEVKNYGNGELVIDEEGNISFYKRGEDVLKEKSPIEQNKYHVSMLNQLLNSKISSDKIHWAIILPNSSVKVINNSNLPVFKIEKLPDYIKSLPNVLTFEEAKWAYVKITKNSVPSPKYDRPIITQNWVGLWYDKKYFQRDKGEAWDEDYNRIMHYTNHYYDDYDDDY